MEILDDNLRDEMWNSKQQNDVEGGPESLIGFDTIATKKSLSGSGTCTRHPLWKDALSEFPKPKRGRGTHSLAAGKRNFS
jgi:hypothetical protein